MQRLSSSLSARTISAGLSAGLPAVKPAQKRFIADASHELKTPLAVISANNEILLAKADRDNRGWLNSSQEEIRNMKSVIDDMLTLAAGEAVGRLEKSPVDLTKLVERCALQFDAVAYEKSIKITTDIADGES